MDALEDIRESFAFFDDWEDKYRFIIDLGKALPNLDASLKTEEHLVRGCQSQVWLIPHFNAGDSTLNFEIDSDAHIVRGLIAIVLAAYNGRTPSEITAFDIEHLFAELDLLTHLSQTRGNGLRAMVGRIVDTAKAHAA